MKKTTPLHPLGKRVLITGINGFVGSHLAEACAARGWRVFGTVRSFRSSLANLPEKHDYTLLPCDLLDHSAASAAVKAANPDYVFHLAAQSFVPASWSSPRATLDANVVGTLHVLEAVRAEAPDAVVQVAGSSEEYGRVEADECPIRVTQPLRPLSPYGVSKVAADMLARQYAASYGMRVIVTRAFNHSGPRRGAAFAESQWARAIALIETGRKKTPLQHGNLDAIRDYTDARDTVVGYIQAVERGRAGAVYNLGWGAIQSPSMSNVLTKLVSFAECNIPLELSTNFMRPSDVPRLICDPSLAESEIGWAPKISLHEMLFDLLNYWRAQVAKEKEIAA
jgi:GDP-4-dehydro-6-deoxy-D-mannose reductase